MQAGFIGLGAMGAPMARNLHREGLLRAVWNRTHGKGQTLAEELGVEFAVTPAELAASCPLIFTCVSADADLMQVVEALCVVAGEHTVVVDCSTVSPETARAAHQRLQGCGAAFLDAPVTGGVEGARQGTLAMMVGGDAAVLQQVRPALDAMAAKVVHMGAVGDGQATKAVNQVMGAGIAQAVTEALAFGEAMGLDMDKVIEAVGSGASASWFLSHRGPTMVKQQFMPGFRVALHRKDLEICRRLAERFAAGDHRLPLVEMTLIHYQRLIEEGHGDEDISALYRQKRKLFGA